MTRNKTIQSDPPLLRKKLYFQQGKSVFFKKNKKNRVFSGKKST
jgi:catabolite regulation protein CreA